MRLDLILMYKARRIFAICWLLKMNITDDWLSRIMTCLPNGVKTNDRIDA